MKTLRNPLRDSEIAERVSINAEAVGHLVCHDAQPARNRIGLDVYEELVTHGGFLFMIYGVVGAVMALQGKNFRYVIIGRRVERFMQPK